MYIEGNVGILYIATHCKLVSLVSEGTLGRKVTIKICGGTVF